MLTARSALFPRPQPRLNLLELLGLSTAPFSMFGATFEPSCDDGREGLGFVYNDGREREWELVYVYCVYNV